MIKTTLAALRYNRTPSVAQFNPVIPPLQLEQAQRSHRSRRLHRRRHARLRRDARRPQGRGGPSRTETAIRRLALYPESITPNLHAVGANLRAGGQLLRTRRRYSTSRAAGRGRVGGDALRAARCRRRRRARSPMDDHGDDPEDYGRDRLSVQRVGAGRTDLSRLRRAAASLGIRRRSILSLNVPALAALNGNVDLDYGPWNPKITNAARAEEFVRDMQRYVHGRPNAELYLRVAADRRGSAGAVDGDHAVGKIVDYLSHTPHWSSTAIFIVPEGLQGRRSITSTRCAVTRWSFRRSRGEATSATRT